MRAVVGDVEVSFAKTLHLCIRGLVRVQKPIRILGAEVEKHVVLFVDDDLVHIRRGALLDDGLHYAEISKQTGASTATITRIASWLNHGEGGYRQMLEKLKSTSGEGSLPYPTGTER